MLTMGAIYIHRFPSLLVFLNGFIFRSLPFSKVHRPEDEMQDFRHPLLSRKLERHIFHRVDAVVFCHCLPAIPEVMVVDFCYFSFRARCWESWTARMVGDVSSGLE